MTFGIYIYLHSLCPNVPSKTIWSVFITPHMAQVTKLERISNMFCNGILSLFSSELLYTTSNYLDIYKYLHLHV